MDKAEEDCQKLRSEISAMETKLRSETSLLEASVSKLQLRLFFLGALALYTCGLDFFGVA